MEENTGWMVPWFHFAEKSLKEFHFWGGHGYGNANKPLYEDDVIPPLKLQRPNIYIYCSAATLSRSKGRSQVIEYEDQHTQDTEEGIVEASNPSRLSPSRLLFVSCLKPKDNNFT